MKEIKKVDYPLKIEERYKMPNGEVVSLGEYLTWLGNKILKIEEALI
jgi:hypothetical protein